MLANARVYMQMNSYIVIFNAKVPRANGHS